MRRVATVATPAAWWWAHPKRLARRFVVSPARDEELPARTPAELAAVAETAADILRLARRTAPSLSCRTIRVELIADLDDAAWSLVQRYVLDEPPSWDGPSETLRASRPVLRAVRASRAARLPVLDLGTARLVERVGAAREPATGGRCATATSDWWQTSAAAVWRWDNTDHVTLRAELIRQSRGLGPIEGAFS